MVRFPNPGSSVQNLYLIFNSLYDALSKRDFFGLDDMSKVLTDQRLAASSGFTGEQALEMSYRDDRSLDPVYNQSKMYSEFFRMLGWISSLENEALKFQFTLLGFYATKSKLNPIKFVEQSLLGICYPNDNIRNLNAGNTRPFKSFLITASNLSNIVCRDELILGPMSHDDNTSEATQQSLQKLRNVRGNDKLLKEELAHLSGLIEITENTMQNYTRIPIAALEYTDWMEKKKMKGIYSVSKTFLSLTEYGKEASLWLENCIDFRKSDFENLPEEFKKSFIIVSFYTMLERAGFDISPMLEEINEHIILVNENVCSREDILFSPYQVLSAKIVNDALGWRSSNSEVSESVGVTISSGSFQRTVLMYDVFPSEKVSKSDHQSEPLVFQILDDFKKGISFEIILKQLMDSVKNMKKEEFYPLIAKLFSIAGLKCEDTRHGINYERWDAIIYLNDGTVIPVEIKSPTEELSISVKGVRQALENKIVLLSREAYKTKKTKTSLVVGYLMPNNRSEVSTLINNIKKTYDIKIGVIDFESLLKIVLQRILFERAINFDDIENLEGMINVKDIETTK